MSVSALDDNVSHTASNRGFWSLIVTQFQGAFSDNVFRALVTFQGKSQIRTVPSIGIH